MCLCDHLSPLFRYLKYLQLHLKEAQTQTHISLTVKVMESRDGLILSQLFLNDFTLYFLIICFPPRLCFSVCFTFFIWILIWQQNKNLGQNKTQKHSCNHKHIQVGGEFSNTDCSLLFVEQMKILQIQKTPPER